MIEEVFTEQQMGLTIAKLMYEKNISQRKLAEISGLSENTIFNILNGNYHHKLDTYKRLFAAMNASIYLVIFSETIAEDHNEK